MGGLYADIYGLDGLRDGHREDNFHEMARREVRLNKSAPDPRSPGPPAGSGAGTLGTAAVCLKLIGSSSIHRCIHLLKLR